jgi:hypothetical protein
MMTGIQKYLILFTFLVIFLAFPQGSLLARDNTYTPEEIAAKAEGFFGDTTEGLAKAIEKVFNDLGRPNGYIAGEEVSGAIGIGLRYGKGNLNRKSAASRKFSGRARRSAGMSAETRPRFLPWYTASKVTDSCSSGFPPSRAVSTSSPVSG